MHLGWSFTRFAAFVHGQGFNMNRNHQVLYGKLPYWELNDNRAVHAIIEGRKPSKPDEAAELGITDGLWWTIDCCWLRDRDMRPDVGAILSRLAEASWTWDMRPQPVKPPS